MCGTISPPIWLTQITLHDVRSAHEHQPGLSRLHWRVALRIDNVNADARQGMSNFSTLAPDLPKTCRAKIVRIHGHCWAAFGATVSFQRSNPEFLLECRR